MKAIVFVGLTIAASWLMVGLYFACGGTWTMPGSIVLSVIYMFVPMTVALDLGTVNRNQPSAC